MNMLEFSAAMFAYWPSGPLCWFCQAVYTVKGYFVCK